MDCKKALQESSGNIDLAIVNLRKSSALKAEKKSSRTALEGIILARSIESIKWIVMVEVNCETDFVAKDKNFLNFCNKVLESAQELHNSDEPLKQISEEVEEARKALVQKVGENVVVRRVESIEGEILDFYIHNNKKIASAVSLKFGKKEIAKEIAMHVVASNPLVVRPNDLSESLVDEEKQIIKAQVSKEDKPKEIIDKMIQGRIDKYFSEVSLLRQPFIKDPNQTVENFLKNSGSEIISFVRMEVGEGIEKEEKDFASEVISQIRDS
ncbi:uncharacterized protein METZ01_LOCUS298625 [marine metagenome]|uniref:Translation elongation factor EFTs/EF1B dimerisation domain-containing protein n=1 Tax=marine metagenome TaxID=408172 RepID=A0A382MEU9_9ZZZZ